MSVVNLKLEQIKDEDFVDDEELSYNNLNDNANVTECGRVFLDLELKTLRFSCIFCEITFQEVYDLVEHVTDLHVIVSTEDSENLYEFEPSVSNILDITACPEEFEAISDKTGSIYEISVNESTDTFQSSSTFTLHKSKNDKNRLETKEDLAIHASESPFQCSECPKAFRTKDILYFHSSIHNGSEKNFKCTHCDQIFLKKRYLQMHLNYHLTNRTFPCEVCGKENRTAHQLKIHMVKHSSEKGYVCEICGSSYRLRHHLVTHQRQTHENKREYQCNNCDRAFNTLAFLNSHKLSHSKVRKHVCKVCGNGFVWRKNLIEHSKLHSDVKKYKCEMCEKSFFQKSGLITHVKSHTIITS